MYKPVTVMKMNIAKHIPMNTFFPNKPPPLRRQNAERVEEYMVEQEEESQDMAEVRSKL